MSLPGTGKRKNSDMAQFSPYKTPGLTLTKHIFAPAAGVTRGNDKIQGAKQKESGKTTLFPANIYVLLKLWKIFLCLHISKLTNYKNATSQLSYTRHISVSKQSNFRSEKGAKTISNAHSLKSLFFHWLCHYWKCCLLCHMSINQKPK